MGSHVLGLSREMIKPEWHFRKSSMAAECGMEWRGTRLGQYSLWEAAAGSRF